MRDYYKFGKVQVLDISRHLTSNAGQAVQYIARSCRLDDNNKGDVESDLRKAIAFLTDELDRIGCYEKSENLNDWTDVVRDALEAKFSELHDARVGTIERTPDGTEWVKSGKDTWGNVSDRQRGSFIDDFGLAKRIVCG